MLLLLLLLQSFFHISPQFLSQSRRLMHAARRNVLIRMPIDCQWVYWSQTRRSGSGAFKLPGIAAPPWVNKLLGLQYDLHLQQQQQQQQRQPHFCGTNLLQQLFLLVTHAPHLTSRAVRLVRLMKKLPQEQVVQCTSQPRVSIMICACLVSIDQRFICHSLSQSGIIGTDTEDE
jgi:hypothetical protein